MGTNRDLDLTIDQIDAILPQTQCGQCGYPGCRPYATALAERREDINQCPPGGEAGIRALAALLAVEFKPFADNLLPKPRAVAIIVEENCIGCTLCIQACPVDAIVGAAKHTHTVIANECTGCELCIAPCPVDCIVIEPLPLAQNEDNTRQHVLARAQHYRHRYQFHQFRLQRDQEENTQRLAAAATARHQNNATAAALSHDEH